MTEPLKLDQVKNLETRRRYWFLFETGADCYGIAYEYAEGINESFVASRDSIGCHTAWKFESYGKDWYCYEDQPFPDWSDDD